MLLVAGVAFALRLSLLPQNLVGVNVVHHYLGAKYAFDYEAIYRLVNAAVERPQVGMRDLERPPALVRDDPREQRAYYLDLLRNHGVAFDPLAPTAALRARAEESGAARAEADAILREGLPPDRAEEFRRDVARALLEPRHATYLGGGGRDLVTDYGYNGSPFWSLLRRADPTLHRPFHESTAILNLAWQALAALLLCAILARALGLDANAALAMAALLFASWDWAGWALPGLVFAGVWLPVALALLALRHGRAAAAGGAVAWAGMIKLFPFALLLPLATLPRRRALRAGIACVLAAAACAALGALSGRSWVDFLRKILVQFQSEGYLANSVSLSEAFLALGVHDSPVPRILSLVALAPLVAMLRPRDADAPHDLPRRALVLLAALGWVVHTWFNYYAMIAVLLLPAAARRRPRAAALAALALAAAAALPEFDDPALAARPVVHLLKLAPYLLVPAWLVAEELRGRAWAPRTRRLAAVAAAAALLLAAAEVARHAAVRKLHRDAAAALDRGDAAAARRDWGRVLALAPGDVPARLNEAIARWQLGDVEGAGAGFARAAAIRPDDVAARKDHARWLLLAGRMAEAETALGAARALAPHDERILHDLARVRLAQGRADEARALLERARELSPDDPAVRGLLASLPAPPEDPSP